MTTPEEIQAQYDASNVNIASQEEVDQLKRYYVESGGDVDCVTTDPRFASYLEELRAFKAEQDAKWEDILNQEELRWLKSHRLNHYYQLSLTEMNLLVDGDFKFKVVSSVISREEGMFGELDFIIYTVKITKRPEFPVTNKEFSLAA